MHENIKFCFGIGLRVLCVDCGNHVYLPMLAGPTDYTAKRKDGEHPEFSACLASICRVSVVW